MTETLTGWLLDVYPNETNLTVWLIGDDGRRHHFVQDFTPALYAAGPSPRLSRQTHAGGMALGQDESARLRQLWIWLKAQEVPVRLSRTERRDVLAGQADTINPTPGPVQPAASLLDPPVLRTSPHFPSENRGKEGAGAGRQTQPPGQMVPVLSIEVLQPVKLDALFRRMVAAFPDLTWYDADISIALRYAAAFDVFPLARVRVELRGEKIVSITPLDTPWEIEPVPAPLRILTLEPDCDPARDEPKSIIVSYERIKYSLPIDKPTALLASLRADLRRYDPDVILTAWGDTWLLPLLAALPGSSSHPPQIETRFGEGRQPLDPPVLRTSPHFPSENRGKEGEGQQPQPSQPQTSEVWETSEVSSGLSLPLNRDETQALVLRKETTYFSYGQIVYRGAQVHLRGRWHLDQHNAMLWRDYGLAGVLEMARVTRQPVQEAARLSPGTGISSMQFVTALQNGILIPWHKQQAEAPKSAIQLLQSDMGGLVYQPTVGLHRDVGGIDFVSMYPGIMVRFNISPEVPRAERASQTSEFFKNSEVSGAGIDLTPGAGEPGIIPKTLAPLLNKRLALKSALLTLTKYDCRRPVYQALASAHKWLLVTCFGYLGYKNARFGRIESHEAVTAYGREALLRAKEAAEDMGFEILHMYVDGLWVQKPGCKTPADFKSLLDEVTERTGLPIAMDGVYRWVVFLPSRVNARVPVPNRYFGVFQDGSVKLRGIEARRHDTAPFIAETQMRLLEILSQAADADHLKDVLPQAQAYARRQDQALRLGRVPLEELLVSLRLSRELSEFSTPSPAARAVWQMQAAGRVVRPGQRVRLLFTLGKAGGFVPPARNAAGTKPAAQPGVHAWDVPERPDPRSIDLPRYRELLRRAVCTVLDPVEQSVVEATGQGSALPLQLFPADRAARLPAYK